MKNRKALFSIFFIMMMSSAAHSQTLSSTNAQAFPEGGKAGAASESPLQSSPSILSIKFIGTKRTKDSYLQKTVKNFIGAPATEETLHKLETVLQTQNLFSAIKFELSENAEAEAAGGSENASKGVQVKVLVKEKISFLPLPFVSGSSDGFSAGLFIMNMNAFGQKDMITVGGIGGSSRIFGMGTYVHPAKVGEPGAMVFASGNKSSSKKTNADGDKILEYDSFGINTSGRLLLKLDRFNSLSFGLGYKGFFLDGDYDFGDRLYTRNLGNFTGGWSISAQDWNGVFLSASSLSLSSDTSADNKGRVVEVISAKAVLQQPISQNLRFNSVLGGAATFNGLITDFSGEDAAGVTILDNNFDSERLAGLSTGLEYALFKLKMGIISVYGNYEAVFAQDYDDTLDFSQGFSAGGKLYLSQLAMPALSFGLNYNATKKVMGFAFSLGMGF